jgi:hypothetical protein
VCGNENSPPQEYKAGHLASSFWRLALLAEGGVPVALSNSAHLLETGQTTGGKAEFVSAFRQRRKEEEDGGAGDAASQEGNVDPAAELSSEEDRMDMLGVKIGGVLKDFEGPAVPVHTVSQNETAKHRLLVRYWGLASQLGSAEDRYHLANAYWSVIGRGGGNRDIHASAI